MNPTVYRAAQLSNEFPEAKYALPPSFPFIVDDDNLEVDRQALRYLDSTFRRARGSGLKVKRKRTSIHSVDAAAYDLVDFLRYLVRSREAERHDSISKEGGTQESVPRALHDFTIDEVSAYRDELFARVSKQTHETLSDGTCTRRVNRALHYGDWLQRRGILFDFGTLPDDDNILLPGDDQNDVVRPLSEREWHRVRDVLGPLPSKRQHGVDERPTRNRLAAELALATGLRVDEVAKLTIHQIVDLRFDDTAPAHAEVKLRVTQTKRLVARNVYIPMYLVKELHLYIDGERREAMTEATRSWLADKQRQHTILFVNGSDARQHAGKAISADVLSNAFHTACIRAGLTSSVEKIDPVTGEKYLTQLASHRFHDLRHTFAVWKYYSEKESGNSEPWKLIQALLGHKHLSTTMNTYLKVVPGERREVNRRTFYATRRRFNGN
ncbi:tyrosine-type recombinase/integrase [Paraburkholderia kirstenboschensis]|uniref:Tyrosine-type recombinase/integrase n=1 Tax=Paraburkholderia kirstenboschensis TaxID=1245436 RepID=A0ABZ0EIA1_9BURK|nr:tyrosine-type recombinase/integrase [Paraburkholderia kirstenboschensis]WOD16953.1 tyrosine-type recombinase/integrase [Paraburkholderia kirstenboschensis]